MDEIIRNIGPTFESELATAGLLGLPFTWNAEGVYGLDQLGADVGQQISDLVAAHDAGAVPRSVIFPNLEPDQFWFGLRVAGYEDDVRTWVASLNDPESPFYNPVDWASASAKLEFAKFFERDHPLVMAAQEAIGLSEVELDALWRFAAG